MPLFYGVQMGFLSETHPDLYNEWDFKENSRKGIDFYYDYAEFLKEQSFYKQLK